MIGLGGVVFVIDPLHSRLSGDLLGALAALGVALGFAVGYVYNVRFLTSHHASGPMIMAVQSALGAVFSTAYIIATADFNYTSNNGAVISLIVLGVLNTGLAAIVFFSLLRDAGAVTTSIVEYLMLLVAVALGVVFLDESITLVTAVGVLLIIAGVAITERKK
jgi:drug/metabolite transporter (DMT)-like permease